MSNEHDTSPASIVANLRALMQLPGMQPGAKQELEIAANFIETSGLATAPASA